MWAKGRKFYGWRQVWGTMWLWQYMRGVPMAQFYLQYCLLCPQKGKLGCSKLFTCLADVPDVLVLIDGTTLTSKLTVDNCCRKPSDDDFRPDTQARQLLGWSVVMGFGADVPSFLETIWLASAITPCSNFSYFQPGGAAISRR